MVEEVAVPELSRVRISQSREAVGAGLTGCVKGRALREQKRPWAFLRVKAPGTGADQQAGKFAPTADQLYLLKEQGKLVR
ncbi:MAG: hypothetical protein RKH07_05415 [Gammaproteobacteria bacterium]